MPIIRHLQKNMGIIFHRSAQTEGLNLIEVGRQQFGPTKVEHNEKTGRNLTTRTPMIEFFQRKVKAAISFSRVTTRRSLHQALIVV